MSADVVTFDASRVSSKELLGIQVVTDDTMVVAPVSILLDQHAAMDTPGAMKLAATQLTARPGSKSHGRRAGTATKLLAHALFWSLSSIFPYKDTSVWMPNAIDKPASMRCYDESTGQWYNWNSISGESVWALDPSLWAGGQKGSRCLIWLCDEGSTGWSLFWFLCWVGMRLLFWRDPSHRLNGTFVNGLRHNHRHAWKATLDLLIVHKFKRAPFGTGKFWRGARETAQMALQYLDHPVITMFLPEIANDLQVPLASLQNKAVLKIHFERFIKSGLGQRVECRRWFTLMKGNALLDRQWHILLVCLVLGCLMEGTCPWTAAARARQMYQSDDENARDFNFKAQVLAILLQPFTRHMLRSELVVFARLDQHHRAFQAKYSKPGESMKFNLYWASYKDWAVDQPALLLQSLVFALQSFGCPPGSIPGGNKTYL